MEKSWQKIKEQFWVGTFVFSFLVCFTFIQTPEYKQSDLQSKKLALSVKPIFKERGGKSRGHWAELYFYGDEKKYEITGIDYKYLKYQQFKDSIDIGEQVLMKVKGEKIYSLSKNGYEYMNFEKAQFHKSQNRTFTRVFSLTGLICCIIPLFFTKQPAVYIGGQTIKIHFGWILIVSMAICIFLLLKHIDFKYISGEEFTQ